MKMFRNWNPEHQKKKGSHAFLSASQHAWVNYDDATLRNRWFGKFQADIGTAVHELANHLIDKGTKLNSFSQILIEFWLTDIYNFPRESYDSQRILENLMPFVNDAIGLHMSSEVVLYYDEDAFGTADVISVDMESKIIRIHDYKNGISPVSMDQPLIYSAYLFLAYPKFDPREYKTYLRIYQNCEINEWCPSSDDILKMMDIIRYKVNKIHEMKGVK